MKRYIQILLATVVIFALMSNQAFSENKKLAQTGLKFLTVAPDARASGMSNALSSLELKSTALFFNPASMARMSGFGHVSFGQTRWIADIDYVYGSAAFRPMDGSLGVFGISLMSVDYGDMQSTILADNDQGFLDVGTFRPSAFSVGIGYAKALTNKFSVGGQIKYVKQNLGGGLVGFTNDEVASTNDFKVDVMAFDFGILYRTGFKSLNFGMNIRNFSQEIEYIEESFQLPLLFEMGISMNAIDLTDISPEQHSLILSIDATHPRDYVEQLDLGVEYIFMRMFALRMGYTTPVDEQGLSFGAGFNGGIQDYSLGVDYSYTPFGIFNDVHRFSVQFSF